MFTGGKGRQCSPHKLFIRPPKRREAPPLGSARIRCTSQHRHRVFEEAAEGFEEGRFVETDHRTSLRDFLRTRDFKRIAEDVALTYEGELPTQVPERHDSCTVPFDLFQ